MKSNLHRLGNPCLQQGGKVSALSLLRCRTGAQFCIDKWLSFFGIAKGKSNVYRRICPKLSKETESGLLIG
ncbi:MAG: hypothetical protein PHS44_08310 [Candidatus Dojkabacteria bacterium]|nr:hypothetical protein [Candidatus Dojkabacteria bacterium]